MTRRASGLIAMLAVALACDAGTTAQNPPAAEPAVERMRVRVVAEYPHDPEAFTQGLVWHAGALLESTGEYGRSTLRRVELESGEVTRQIELPPELFGEGLERIGDRLLQLTWREQLLLEYRVESFERIGEWRFEGEGWGLCFDGRHLVRSDGTAHLAYHDPGTFALERSATVTLEGLATNFLNELECVDGVIYANIWTSDSILRIDASSAKVTGVVDASSLLPDRTAAGVLNGIAYRPETGTFLLTGKNWPKLYEVAFEPTG